jgi:hypothetical protein
VWEYRQDTPVDARETNQPDASANDQRSAVEGDHEGSQWRGRGVLAAQVPAGIRRRAVARTAHAKCVPDKSYYPVLYEI